MSEKLALVVDDSRMARVVLSKMLSEQHISVDQVESGEEALGYLCDHRPDMIFMDHTMPGMDGFQTLRAIRNDPKHAHIPIMMYTSKEGEVFVSQARALGAAAVIPKKKLRAEQLVRVLEGQNLLPKRATGADSSTYPPISPAIPPENKIVDLLEDDLHEVTKAVENSIRHRTSADTPLRRMLHEYRDQLSHDRRADLSDTALRIEEKLLHLDARLDQMQSEQLAETSHPHLRNHWVGIIALSLLATSLWLGSQLATKNNREEARKIAIAQETTSATSQNAQAQERITALDRENRELVSQQKKVNTQLYSLLGTTLSQQTAFAFGTPPFNNQLAERLDEIAGQLYVLGFRGAIILRSHLGKYCTKTRSNGETSLADAKALVSSCEINEISRTTADERGMAQTNAFRSTVSSLSTRVGDHIKIILDTAGTEESLHPYPELSDALKAGEWNQIADQNQRVEVKINSF
ncbi:Predicted response regulator receiver [gamma proteobacterium HdN1]|nr:Predicted response regulator receiver [gamma proteobacterium HdN1]